MKVNEGSVDDLAALFDATNRELVAGHDDWLGAWFTANRDASEVTVIAQWRTLEGGGHVFIAFENTADHDDDRLCAMFMETITAPVDEWNLVNDKSHLTDDPPAGLIAHIAWESGPDEVTAVMVWETASQRGDFAAEVMMPLFESGELADVSSNPSPVQAILAQFPGHEG